MSTNKPVTRSQAKKLQPSVVVVSPSKNIPKVGIVNARKRLKPETPPNSEPPSRRTSDQEYDDSSLKSDTRVTSKLKYVTSLYTLNLKYVDYYRILGISRTTTFHEIKKTINKLTRVYKQNEPYQHGGDVQNATQNSLDDILKVLNDANHTLTRKKLRDIYNSVLDKKQVVKNYKRTVLKPLENDITAFYNNVLRINNNLKDFYDSDIGQRLKEKVLTEIDNNTRNKYFKTTKTNRILVEWNIYNDIDEQYLKQYFQDDGVVGLVLCSNRPGCAVIELLTQKSVKSIIEREAKGTVFTSVRDYTEAEFTANSTDFTVQKDKLIAIENELKELQDKINLELDKVEPVNANDEAALDMLVLESLTDDDYEMQDTMEQDDYEWDNESL
ncbi:bJDP-like protein [Helicoverpa armigera multiple nucleopolyhedrovirus]|uniref:Bjdp n=1 Tax=Mamestra brassicae nuclear polyhedrosis virus TaxID=78219 RepID=A0A077D0W6_NPVMB|nr:bJDP-like protein [Helicoverpa armigera multiple nucleopolyhedrovirus]AIL25211.1 bjdp [Mamestra brassicae multiple nucleopolyhedrovirus]